MSLQKQQLEKRYFECRTFASHYIDHGNIISIQPAAEEVIVIDPNDEGENYETVPLPALGDEEFIEEVLDNPVHWKEVTNMMHPNQQKELL